MEITDPITKRKWNIGFAHSKLNFRVKHLVIDHLSGTFKESDETIYPAEDIKTVVKN
jgi:polyisoprenoid-binding protein YceI